MRRMSSIGRTGLVAAMENEEVNNPAVAEVEGGAENLETELLDVQEETVEAEQAEAEIEETVETAEALEAMAVSLEACAANGGLNKEAAHAVGIALDHMYRTVGITKTGMPALESFGKNSSRTGATQLVLESLSENIKRIWDAVVKAVADAIEWVRQRFEKVMGAATRLEKRAKALSARAEATPQIAAKEKAFDSERTVQALQINGSVSNVKAGLAAVQKLVEGVLTSDTSKYDTATEAMQNPQGVSVDSIKGLASLPSSIQLRPVASPENEGFGAQPAGVFISRSDELLGGKAVIKCVGSVGGVALEADAAAPASGATGIVVEALNASSKLRLSIGAFNAKAKATTKTSVATLSIGEAGDLADVVAAIAGDIAAYKQALGKIDSAKKKLLSAVKRAGDDLKKEEDAASKGTATALAKFASALPRILDGLPTGVSTYALNVGKAACDYAELSLNQYKE